jgi:hypothetical protein
VKSSSQHLQAPALPWPWRTILCWKEFCFTCRKDPHTRRPASYAKRGTHTLTLGHWVGPPQVPFGRTGATTPPNRPAQRGHELSNYAGSQGTISDLLPSLGHLDTCSSQSARVRCSSQNRGCQLLCAKAVVSQMWDKV